MEEETYPLARNGAQAREAALERFGRKFPPLKLKGIREDCTEKKDLSTRHQT